MSQYHRFEDLPAPLKAQIRELRPDADHADWVKKPIPALGGRSVLEAMSSYGGELEVDRFLNRAIGR